ncbi:unnamed protein product [Thelazia callipaeda]|uniref:C2H2-type domain-containing protein n=1 Tax=Thelazia callipaeda TaxID=103827 RepID=A0A0N5CKD0_THECL|nr:unnamed protein product [Thelazia callipaeda]
MDVLKNAACTCCRVFFTDGDSQREHYKSDWHRYNLQRKKVAREIEKAESFTCECCKKQFQSTNAYDNHINSKKHKETEKASTQRNAQTIAKRSSVKGKKTCEKIGDHFGVDNIENENDLDELDNGWVTDHDTDEEDFDESKAISNTVCLFCNHVSRNLETNLQHMSKSHGFFLPDVEFCVDISGMLHYLGLKVGSGHMCLSCNERRTFLSLDACQKHMQDKGHCFIDSSTEGLAEFEDFYDYSSLYTDEEKTGGFSDVVIVSDGYSLTLPSGARIGHRSLLRYYKQRLKPLVNESESHHQKKAIILKKAVIGQYKQLRWNEMTGTLALQRAKDMLYIKNSAKKWLKTGLSNNKLFKSRGRSDQ